MADTQYLTVSGDNAGTNYNSATTWAAQDRDLVTEAAGGVILRVKDDFGGDLTGVIDLSGWTSDASNPIVIMPNTAADGHQGVKGDGFAITNTSNTVSNVIKVTGSNHVTIKDISVKMTGTTNANPIFYIGVTSDVILERLFITGLGTGGVGRGIYRATGTDGGTLIVDSCEITSTSTTRQSAVYRAALASTEDYFYNCVFKGWARAFYSTSANVATCINCAAIDCTTTTWETPSNYTTSLNCAADDANAPTGGTPVQDLSTADGVDFVSPSTGDLRPQPSGKLDGAGYDNSASGYTTDIAGVTRA